MSGRSTSELIREIARDVAPVRPIPRLQWVVVAMLALWLAALGVESLLGGIGLRLVDGPTWSDPGQLVALIGLALLALGASVAALAVAVPGRHATARGFGGLAALGLLVAVGSGVWDLLNSGSVDGAQVLRSSVRCIQRALLLGVAPTLLASAFVAHASLRRPRTAAALALAGGIALGAFAVHASCPSGGALHALVGHTLVPVAAAAILVAPLAALLGRWVHRRMARWV